MRSNFKFDHDSEKRSAKKACEDRRAKEAAGDVLKTVMVSILFNTNTVWGHSPGLKRGHDNDDMAGDLRNS